MLSVRPRSGHLFHRFGLMVAQFIGDRCAVHCNSRGPNYRQVTATRSGAIPRRRNLSRGHRYAVEQFRRMFFGRFGRRLRMTKERRNIGHEMLTGLREIKSGRHGRVVNLPSHPRKDRALTRTFRNIARGIGTNITGLGASPPSPVWRRSHTAFDRRAQSEGIARCRVTAADPREWEDG